MQIKEQLVKSLFADDGKAVYVPIDHGIGGIKKGLDDPVEVLSRLLKAGIDGTLMQLGMAKQTKRMFDAMGTIPARIIAMDYRHYWKIPGYNEGVLGCFQSASVEQALAVGASAVKVMIPYGGDKDVTIGHIRILTKVVREADFLGIPVMVEPLPSGNCPEEYVKSHDVVANAARIAIELGADVLKLPYTGDREKFTELIRVSRIPVTVLGGSPKDIKTVLSVTKEIMECGARAVVFGRNVWGHPEMEKVVASLRAIVHENGTVEETLDRYQLSGCAVTDQSYTI